MFCGEIINMEEVHLPETEPLFVSVNQAIGYYLGANPARAKSLNLLEPEGGCKPAYEQFSGGHPADIWAKVCLAVQAVENQCSDKELLAFRAYWLKEAPEFGKKQIASCLGISARCFKWQREMLEEELISRRLMWPPDNEMH